MARDEYARIPGESSVEWALRRARLKADKRDKTVPLVTPEAANQGDYRPVTVLDPSGDTRNSAKTLVNRGGTPVCRWASSGRLSDSQMTVILECQRLWRIAGGNPRVTGTYGERIAGLGNADLTTAFQSEARDTLNRYARHFEGALKAYWDVFENVCRFGIAAGVAGAGAGYEGKAAEKRAHLTVCFVADILATHERF